MRREAADGAAEELVNLAATASRVSGPGDEVDLEQDLPHLLQAVLALDAVLGSGADSVDERAISKAPERPRLHKDAADTAFALGG